MIQRIHRIIREIKPNPYSLEEILLQRLDISFDPEYFFRQYKCSEEILNYFSDSFTPLIWKSIYNNYNLTEDFIRKHFKTFLNNDFALFLKNQNVQSDLILDNIDNISIPNILAIFLSDSIEKVISYDLIEKFKNKLNKIYWKQIIKNKNIPNEYIKYIKAFIC